MRRYTVLTIATSAIFLMFVGVLTNSQALFYMSTVMIITLIGMRVQAELATRGLRFERIAPGVIVAGELVAMRIRVWSSIRLRRPLLFITDDLPPGLLHDEDTRPLPIAPSFDEAVETRYNLRPLKRGVYRWSRIRVRSTDSLGIVGVERVYPTDPMQVIVHPAKIPFALDLVALSGWGASQADQGRNKGQGMEPRGVRGFYPGDPLRHVHWRTTARTGTIQVKEFETGFNTNIVLLIQLTEGSEFGEGGSTTLEAMCGNAAFLADVMLNRGSRVVLPNLEEKNAPYASASEIRYRQICDALAGAQAVRQHAFASEIAEAVSQVSYNSTMVIMLTTAESGLAEAIRHASAICPVVVMVYDSARFATEKQQKMMKPAASPEFLRQIAAPTVAIKLMENPYAEGKAA